MVQYVRNACTHSAGCSWLRSFSTSRTLNGPRKQKKRFKSADTTLDDGIREHYRYDDGPRTQFSRADGRRPLPLPPIMDPVIRQNKERYKQPKAELKFSEMTEFQKELSINPYARALSQKVRYDCIIGTRLPMHFLVNFGLEFHQQPEDAKNTKKKAVVAAGGKKYSPALVPVPKAHQAGQQAHALALRHVIGSLDEKMSKKRGRWTSLLNQTLVDKAGVRERVSIIWNDGASEVHLQSMRDEAVKSLRWSFQRGAGARLIQRLEDGIDGSEEPQAKAPKEPACVMLLSGTGGLDVPTVDHHSAIPHVVIKGKELPVYDLRRLLGEECLKTLTEGSNFADAEVVTLSKSHLTAASHVNLLKLYQYMAESPVEYA